MGTGGSSSFPHEMPGAGGPKHRKASLLQAVACIMLRIHDSSVLRASMSDDLMH
jgi:hypothetical protein